MEKVELISMVSALFIGIIMAFIVYCIKNAYFFPKEGRIYNIDRGNAHKKCIAIISGWHLNKPRSEYFDPRYDAWEILPDKWGPPEKRLPYGFLEQDCDREKTNDDRSFLEKKINLHCVGLWPLDHIRLYKFEWLKLKQKGDVRKEENVIWESEDKTQCIVKKSEIVDSVLFRTPYAVLMSGVETGGPEIDGRVQMIPIDILMTVMVQAWNTVKMIYKTSDWFAQFLSACKGVVRDVAGIMSLEAITKSQNEEGEENSFVAKMLHIVNTNEGSNHGAIDLHGFALGTANFEGYKISGENAKALIEASTLEYIAEKGAKAKKLEGEGLGDLYKAKREREADADRDYKIKTGLAKEENGKIVGLVPDPNLKAMSDAIGKHTGSLVLGQNIMPTIPIDSTNNVKP